MKNIELINASAGSGKTFSLTERVIQTFDQGVSPESLMATTFTKKAAAELRERIRQRLLAAGKHDEAQRVFDGFIGTVNSVCARLLSEYALDAGLSPALDVMPNEDSVRLFRMAIARVVENHADDVEPIARRLSRVGEGSGHARTEDWRHDVETIVTLARSNLVSADELEKHATRTWEALRGYLGKTSKTVSTDRLEPLIDVAIKQLESNGGKTAKTAKALDALRADDRCLQQGRDLPWAEWIRLSKLEAAKADEVYLEPVREFSEKVMSHPQFQDDMQRYIQLIFQCAARSLDAYDTFKHKQGLIDFVDQETLVLKLALNNKAFASSLSGRLQQIMVDEFQDTSPIQLSLFLALHRLVGKSVWVGDPKQAIYGFRGTDPKLMEAVANEIPRTSTLDKSWRSRETLVNFSNAVFTDVFHGMGKEKVQLGIPEARKQKAKGGWLETWQLTVKNKPHEASAIANGVQNLLAQQPELLRSDIAILCRANDQCADIAAALERRGIRASASQGTLLQTRECQLALAALRYLQDAHDSVALAEIVHLSPLHAQHKTWLQDAVSVRKDALD